MNDLNDTKIQEQIEWIIKQCDECIIPAIQKMVDVIASYVQELIDAIMPLLGEAIKNMTEIYEATINSYPNKRVLHLAKYHPKERVRKKNMRRVLKWIERGL